MKIFVDTNVFYNNWYLKKADFKFLFNFIGNNQEHLLLSQLVIEEVDNKFQQQFNAIKNELTENFRKFSSLLPYDINYPLPDESDYSFKAQIDGKVEDAIVFNYDKISQTEVVARAMKQKKPFSKSEKGYRDTLIWLSLLEYIKTIPDSEEIIIISENSSDFFFIENSEIKLHKDLIFDLKKQNIQNKIIPYKSLNEFVKDNIKIELHELNTPKIINAISHQIEHLAEEYLYSLTSDDLSEAYELDDKLSIISSLKVIDVDIFEGEEDLEITAYSKLNDFNIHAIRETYTN
ncbi:hypothetical protein A8A01_23195 [Ewingella americana]|nr:hypothetical protein A8A01_23195 [Ewingella americana]